MTLAHARSLLAGMSVQEQPATPEADGASLRKLARWMLRFAPVVSPDGPDGLMLDIAGCGQLFGGERDHSCRIAQALKRAGLRPRLAAAPTFACAWALARFGEKPIAWIAEDEIHAALAPLPVCGLRIGTRIVESLADVGIERIEHLLALPRDELAARFGRELLRRLDQATGAAGEGLQSIQPIRHVEEAHDFDGPIRRFEIIEATTRELLARLLTQLQPGGLGLLELSVELQRVELEPQMIALRLTYPNRDLAHLWKLLSSQLERAHLGFGVETITLRALRTGRIPVEQAAFLRDAARDAADQSAALGELLDSLIDRLGAGAVKQIDPTESYVPERTFVTTAVREIAPRSSKHARVSEQAVDSVDRPSQLFERPEPIRVMSLVPDGPPVWLDWHGLTGNVIAGVGPERIVFPWWRKQAGMRDYFEVEDEHGRRLWVFRDGRSGDWFVHGQWM
jgi:protein ImuB